MGMRLFKGAIGTFDCWWSYRCGFLCVLHASLRLACTYLAQPQVERIMCSQASTFFLASDFVHPRRANTSYFVDPPLLSALYLDKVVVLLGVDEHVRNVK
jgi:hypothetical protein